MPAASAGAIYFRNVLRSTPPAGRHLVLRPARTPVHQDLGHIDHVEHSPCHRPPSSHQTAGKIAPPRWPGPPPHAHPPHGELRDQGGELRDHQPLRARELRERRQPRPSKPLPSPGRPYDLRHACLSTWLNGGVYPTQVAEWAGHSVDVLLRIYAKCVVGQDELAKRRISEALRED